jgi:hypothetical protein
MMTTKRGRRTAVLAVTMMMASAAARAQTPEGAPASACASPCAATERCVEGQCLPNPDARPVPAAPPAAKPAPIDSDDAAAKPAAAEKAEPRAAAKAPEPELEPWRRGMLVLPQIGAHTVQGIAADGYGAGFRLGALLGVRVTPAVSLNVELATNFLSPKDDPALPGVHTSGHDFTAAFAPLFHGRAENFEVVVGPKLGLWTAGLETTVPGSTPDKASLTGWALGFNLGAFVGVGDYVALGALISYQASVLGQSCTLQTCTIEAPALQFLTVSLGLLL